MDAQTDC